jgi:hypothetical protein
MRTLQRIWMMKCDESNRKWLLRKKRQRELYFRINCSLTYSSQKTIGKRVSLKYWIPMEAHRIGPIIEIDSNTQRTSYKLFLTLLLMWRVMNFICRRRISKGRSNNGQLERNWREIKLKRTSNKSRCTVSMDPLRYHNRSWELII